MKKFLILFLLLAFPLWAQVQLGGNVQVSGTTLICATPSEGTVATPTASPAAGSYSSTQSVTLSTSTGGATICYTTDGSTPTASAGSCTHGTTYSTAISVSTTQTIKAIATESGYVNSGVLTAAYTISGGSTTLSISPTSIAEGSILANTTAYFQPVTVTNTGSSNLTFSAIGFTGTNSGDFSITKGFTPAINPVGGNTLPLCTTANPVLPSASCIVPIDFVPGANGSRSASLQFTDNATGSPHTVALTGTGTAASGTILPACGSLLSSASTTYYATGNITCNGSGFGINASNITVNLNGYILSVGNSPGTAKVGSMAFYTAIAGDAGDTAPCLNSAYPSACLTGTTATTDSTVSSLTIENGTVNLAAGAVSAATEQVNSMVFYAGYGLSSTASNVSMHDLTINIPVNCISCGAESGYGGTTALYNGVGDKVWKVTVNNNSGQVYSRCEYQGADFVFNNNGGTADPGPILYDNNLPHSPQDGIACVVDHCYIFGNTIAVGNPSGTDAGTASTCSGIGTGANGTESANDFAIGAYRSYDSVVNNTIDNYEGRGIDLTVGTSSPTSTYSAGNTITTTDLPNYVEYNGNAGNQLGGSLGIRFNQFGNSAPDEYSSNDTVTNTCVTSEGSAYSISNNATSTSHADNMTLVSLYGSGATKDYNCNGVQDVSQTYTTNSLFTFNGGTVTSDTSAVNIGNEEDGSSGLLAFVGTTFVKPSTATAGWCGHSVFGIPEAGWVLTMACYPSYVNGNPIGPVYYVNPIFSGGAAYPDDDFALATTYLPSGTIATSYLMYTYQVTVTGASSGNPIVGATVTATDTHSGLECTATTNSSGVASCNGAPGSANAPLYNTERTFTAPAAPTTTTFNPFAFSISKTGCTTNTYSESITGPTVEAKTLSGC